jgi:hypothetical protein
VILAVVKRGARRAPLAKKQRSAQRRPHRMRTEQKVADEPSSGGSRGRTGRGGGASRPSKKSKS